MQHMRLKLIVGSVALVLAVTYLALAGLREGWVYHVQVSEFFAKPDMAGQRLRVCGTVCPEQFESNPAKMTASFLVRDSEGKTTRTLAVMYRGTIPDLFKPDTDVVVEGKLDATGTFQSDLLMTKCASKYQSEEHAKRNKE